MGGQFAPKSVVNLDWKVVVNLTVFSTDADGNELEGNINVEGKYGKGTITNLDGNKIEISTEWIGYGKLIGIDDEGNEYEIVVKINTFTYEIALKISLCKQTRINKRRYHI